jgi:AraC-like DNA-binding protein
MDITDQRSSIDEARLGQGDFTCFWRDSRFGDLECLRAEFHQHVYAPHSHETFVVGFIERGAELFECRGTAQVASAGDVSFVNPLEKHDGSPGPDGYAYRMLYPSTDLMQQLASELVDRPVGVPHFRQTVVRDPEAARLLMALHETLETNDDLLARDSALCTVMARLLARHGDLTLPLPTVAGELGAVSAAMDYMRSHLDSSLGLDEVAAAAGMDRFRLIRAFRRETGFTPLAWMTNQRVNKARLLLGQGESPAEVAATVGFFDQAHLGKAFKARVGVTPGAYRSAFAARFRA